MKLVVTGVALSFLRFVPTMTLLLRLLGLLPKPQGTADPETVEIA